MTFGGGLWLCVCVWSLVKGGGVVKHVIPIAKSSPPWRPFHTLGLSSTTPLWEYMQCKKIFNLGFYTRRNNIFFKLPIYSKQEIASSLPASFPHSLSDPLTLQTTIWQLQLIDPLRDHSFDPFTDTCLVSSSRFSSESITFQKMVLTFLTNPYNNYYRADSKEFVSLDKLAK